MTPGAPPLSRLFAAVGWRHGGADDLLRLREQLRETLVDAPLRWSAAADLHVTLRFYGDATPAQGDAIAAQLQAHGPTADAQPLEFDQLETWPPKRPTLLVATLRAPPLLRAQQDAIEHAARVAGFPAEARAWKPHVTLARARQWDGAMPRFKLLPFALPSAPWVLWYRKSVTDAGYAQYWP